jgi:hypothetical protein
VSFTEVDDVRVVAVTPQGYDQNAGAPNIIVTPVFPRTESVELTGFDVFRFHGCLQKKKAPNWGQWVGVFLHNRAVERILARGTTVGRYGRLRYYVDIGDKSLFGLQTGLHSSVV